MIALSFNIDVLFVFSALLPGGTLTEGKDQV